MRLKEQPDINIVYVAPVLTSRVYPLSHETDSTGLFHCQPARHVLSRTALSNRKAITLMTLTQPSLAEQLSGPRLHALRPALGFGYSISIDWSLYSGNLFPP